MCTECMAFIVVYLVLFFFFKQKTAYEMRISDWSSDVCSSDLLDTLGAKTHGVLHGALHCAAEHNAFFKLLRDRIGNQLSVGFGLAEIGRASCRESVSDV